MAPDLRAYIYCLKIIVYMTSLLLILMTSGHAYRMLLFCLLTHSVMPLTPLLGVCNMVNPFDGKSGVRGGVMREVKAQEETTVPLLKLCTPAVSSTRTRISIPLQLVSDRR